MTVAPSRPIPDDASAPRPTRVVLQQFALPKYRLPVFQALARRPGIDFTLVYSEYPGLPNVAPEGLHARIERARFFSLLRQEFWWHSGQWRGASRKNADVLILSWSTRYLSLVPSLLRARLAGVRTILWGHGFSKRPSWLRYKLMTAVTRLADAVVFYNRTNANRFLDRGYNPQRVFVALNSLDQAAIQIARAHWTQDPAKLRAFRAEKGLTGPYILFVSRLDANNLASLMVQAAPMVLQRHPGFKIVVVGKGEEHDTIVALAEQLGVREHVVLPGAIYDEVELAPYFLAASAFCYPRNIGLSILHAFGYALPVITGDDASSHNPEFEALIPGENGLLFHDKDPDALADAILRVLDDPALRETLARGAQRTVDETFCIERMVDGFHDAIRYVTSDR